MSIEWVEVCTGSQLVLYLRGLSFMKYSGIGGQAVLEGVMMKNDDKYAVAVRKSDKTIEVKKDTHGSNRSKTVNNIPIIRGIYNFVDSLVLGMTSINFSSEMYMEDIDEEPGKFELFLDRVFGEKAEKIIMGITTVISVVLALGIFTVVPFLLSLLFRRLTDNHFAIAFLEGIIRVSIFVFYIKLISLMDEIKRLFMYHGAEHKCINCIEHGMELTVENVRKSSRQHKRCGTSFLLFVMVISILFFMFIYTESPVLRLVLRLLLIPLIAGVSYEFLRFAGRHDNLFVNIISKPGMWLQNLTTREPEDEMIEVGIASVEAVFDWKAYLTENFGMSFPEEHRDIENEILGDACQGQESA